MDYDADQKVLRSSEPMLCPQCEKLILAENANLETLTAKCVRCQHVFRFDSLIPYPPKPVDAVKPVIEQPKRCRLVETDGKKSVSTSLNKATALIMLVYLCPYLLFFIYINPLSAVDLKSNSFHNYILLPPFFAMSIFILFAVPFYFLNSTSIGVDDESLFVVHHPIHWFGFRLPRESVSEFYVEKSIKGNLANPEIQFYSIFVLTLDGQRKKLGFRLELPEARFIVDRLNCWLNVKPSLMGVPVLNQSGQK